MVSIYITSQILQQTLIQQIEKDGLKLCHFETKIKSLKLSWVKIKDCVQKIM